MSVIIPVNAAISVEPTLYRGYSSIRMSNSAIEVIITPGLNRLMSVRLLPDGRNFLRNSWVHRHYPWVNYGGSFLLTAPQSAWKHPWPPPCAKNQTGSASILPDKSVLLSSPECSTTGVAFSRCFRLHPELPMLFTEDRIRNISSQVRSWGIWEISQLRPGGQALIPFIPPSQKKTVRNLNQFSFQHRGNTIIIRDTQTKVKGFHHSSSGVMGYLLEDNILWRFSPAADPGAVYPQGEDSLSFYSGQGAFELEYVSPLMSLKPGEVRSSSQIWIIGRHPKINFTVCPVLGFIPSCMQ